MTIKLIGLDLDGTVFDSKKRISQRTKQAIQQAIQKDVIVMITTGRPYRGLPTELTGIKNVRYALSSNGATVFDFVENKTLYKNCMTGEKAIEIAKCMPDDALLEMYVDGIGYISSQHYKNIMDYISIELRNYIRDTRIPVDDLYSMVVSNSDVEKVHILFPTKENKLKVLDNILKIKDIAVVDSIENNMEITKSGVSKGSTLIEFGKTLGISPNEIMACGDSENDYTMIESAGLGVAMGNASDRIKKISDFITLTNDENGVAHAIEKFVL